MTKLIYAAALILALAATHAVAQSRQGDMQQWLNSHCGMHPASPVCGQLIVRKQPVTRPGTFRPYPGPIDLCPPPYFKLDARDGCIEVRRVRRDAFPNAGNEAPLFDHLVGAHQHRLRNREAERLGCVEVY